MSTLEKLPEDKDARRTFDLASNKIFGGDAMLCAWHSLALAAAALPPGNGLRSLLNVIANEIAAARKEQR